MISVHSQGPDEAESGGRQEVNPLGPLLAHIPPPPMLQSLLGCLGRKGVLGLQARIQAKTSSQTTLAGDPW